MGLSRALTLVAAGAALAYFLDPEHGPERREKVSRMLERAGGASPRAQPAAPIVTTPEGDRRTAGS